ncbi:MAG: glycoside hydrolase family 88 protein [Clostridia bacterium]|nr:glycoside hydrolase family 88 protein [Clostridia bacterium]
MAGPLMATYGKKQKKPVYIDIAVEQALLMYEHIQDKETKLLYHAWDPSKNMPWADNKTGLSPEFWGRALGWYIVALLDIMEHMNAETPEYKSLQK